MGGNPAPLDARKSYQQTRKPTQPKNSPKAIKEMTITHSQKERNGIRKGKKDAHFLNFLP